MNTRARTVVPTALCLAAALLTGCVDEEAQERREVQQQITKASLELQQAAAAAAVPGDPSFEELKRRLNSVATDLSRLNTGRPGQQAAAALMASTARRELASISLSQVKDLETEHRHIRASLHDTIDAALRLSALADGRAQLTTEQIRAQIERARSAARSELEQQRAVLDRVRDPIAELVEENEADLNAASRLDQEASELRQRATRLGPAEGLESFEQAIALEREADQYKYRIAQRENDLRYELEPQQQLAEARVEHLQSVLDQIEVAEDALAAEESQWDEQADTTRTLVNEFRDRIDDELDLLNEQMNEQLAGLYDEASNHLDEAIQQAQRAAGRAGRNGGDAARIAAARAQELLGRLHWTRARALDDHIRVLERLVDHRDDLNAGDRYQAELDATTADYQNAINRADEAFSAALSELEQVRGRENQTEVSRFRQGLEMSLDALHGRAVSPPVARGGSSMSGGGVGALDSPEALVAYLNSLGASSDPQQIDRVLDLLYSDTAEGRRMIELMRAMMSASSELQTAFEQQFGAEATPGLQQTTQMGVPATAGNARLISQSGDQAVIAATPAGGGPQQELVLVNANGTWMIDLDESGPQTGMEINQESVQALESMVDFFRDFAARVRDGEFANQQQASQQFMGGFMGIMSELQQGGA